MVTGNYTLTLAVMQGATMTMKGNCNLCNKYKELQKVCHVLPEFFYRDINLFHEHHNPNV